MFEIEFSKSFVKDFKKITHEVQKEFMGKWIPRLQSDPLQGLAFSGKNLKAFRRLKFRTKKNDYRVVYEIKNTEVFVILLAIGSRENFYKRIQTRLP